MSKTEERGKGTIKADSICWDCVNAVPCKEKGNGCEWSVNKKPVEGWTAEETHIDTYHHPYTSFCVTKCPKYERRISFADRMHELADFDGLFKAVLDRAIEDRQKYFDGLERAVHRKDIEAALKYADMLNDVNAWFKVGCRGMLSDKTANAIYEFVSENDAKPSEKVELPENIVEDYMRNIRLFMSGYIKKSEHMSEMNKLEARLKAEYWIEKRRIYDTTEEEIARAFKESPRICSVCRKHKPRAGRCERCHFKWAGNPYNER